MINENHDVITLKCEKDTQIHLELIITYALSVKYMLI